ncbi:MAG: PilZ domain-containing protein [Pseudomonadales bacterium]|nr:PilZ domain-containing protein [Pseudomonadales bacterium]
MRNFIRHASDIPLEIQVETNKNTQPHHAVNISQGGISFTSEEAIQTGKLISIRVPAISDVFHFEGQVAWCSKSGNTYTIGIQFYDALQSFTARMVEQICYIESYRKEMLKTKGRKLNSNEAAEEWVALYADKFPDIWHHKSNTITNNPAGTLMR